MNSLPNFLRERSRFMPDKLALESKGKKYTFREMDEAAIHFGEKLVACGIQSNEIVALYGNNQPETVFVIHALFYIGAKILLLNKRLTGHELEWQLKHAKVEKLVSTDEITFEGIQTIVIRELQNIKGTSFSIKENFENNEVATIMYTSGTTGNPKAVLQRFGNHYHSAVSSCENLGLDSTDKWLCITPLYHVSGLSIILRSVIVGLSVHLMENFDERNVNQVIMEKGITIVSVVTNILSRLMTEEIHYPLLFKGMLLGGGPAPIHLLEKCRDRGLAVFLSYGMTETCSQIVTLRSEEVLKKLGSAGKPIPGCEVKIMADKKECQKGVSGEIVVKGPNVTEGYLYGEKSEAFQDGWFYTGDIGYLDEDGFLYILDRRSDLFISGGENVYPAEIESVLMSFPNVLDAGVVGAEDEKWGAIPVAFIVLDKSISLEKLSCFCEERLARFKVPKKFIIEENLPRNVSGKLLRKDLRERLK